MTRAVSPAGSESHEPAKQRVPQVEDQIDAMGWGKFQFIATATFMLFIVSDGMELVVTNITFRAMPAVWGMDDAFRGVLASASFIGFVAGAFLGGYLGDHVGRRTVLWAHAAVFIPFTLISALSQSAVQLMVTRFFVGVSMGMVLPTSVAFLSELCPTHVRGLLITSLPCFAYTVGQVTVLAVGIALIRVYGDECESDKGCDWWRYMMISGVVPDLMACVLVYFYVPESPRYFAVQGKHEEAEKAIRWVAEVNGAEDQLLDGGMVSSPEGDQKAAHEKFIEMFIPPLRDVMFVIVFTWCFLCVPLFGQSFMYPIILEKQFHMSALDQYTLLIQFVCAELLGLLLCFVFIDNADFGRKRTIIMFCGAGVAAGIFVSQVAGWSLGWVHASQITYKVFASTPYEIMYVYAAELLPTTHRNQGISIGNSSTKLIGGFFLPLGLSVLLSIRPPAEAVSQIFVGFCFSSIAALLMMMFFGRETVGRKMLDLPTDKPGCVQEQTVDSRGYTPIGSKSNV